MIVYYFILPILSYLIGNFSTAGLIARYFKSLNIYKIGTGHPDTENIYKNVSKPLGVFAGIVDFSKMYVFLWFTSRFLIFLNPGVQDQNYLLTFAYGFMMIVGHCLPVVKSFKGGRGMFTLIGLWAFFAPQSIIAVLFLVIVLIVFFKQIRFSQYMLVLLPPFIHFFFFEYNRTVLLMMLTASILVGVINFIVSKRLGEI